MKTKQKRPRLRRARGGAGVVLGLLAALTVAGLGAVYVEGQPVQYSASNQLLIAPSSQLDASATSSYWETLANGQVPATAAAIVSDKRLLKAATADLPAATAAAVLTTVSVVPSTAVINVRVTAPTAAVAEQVANSIAERSTTEVSDALAPYEFKVISDADGTATMSSLSHSQYGILVGVVALFVGIVVQQLISWRSRLRRRSAAAAAPEPADA